jgi:ribosomal-protein-alanine N-acetyltransferase
MTDRLILHRPSERDAEEIFERYASHPDVTKYVGFKTHTSIEDTREFLLFSDAHWQQWPAGPLLIRLKENHRLIGSTGLSFDTSYRAMTGYILAREAWDKGYATEALNGIIEISKITDLHRIYALCHTQQQASWRVLEKCGFMREGRLRSYIIFPNLNDSEPQDVYCYSLII